MERLTDLEGFGGKATCASPLPVVAPFVSELGEAAVAGAGTTAALN